MSLTWKLEVKWDASYVDEVARMRGLRVKRGRQHFVAPGGRGLEPMRPGEAVIELLNTDDRYNPYNSDSPIYGDIAPGKLVRLSVVDGDDSTTLTWDTNQDLPNKEWKGIWGSAADDVFVVTNDGVIYHWDGSAWSAMSSGTTKDLLGVWGAASDDVWAVGDDGTIRHYDGSAWSASSSGTTEDLRRIWGSSASDVFVVGRVGTILHWNGSSWSTMTSGTTDGFRDVWGTASNNVYAVGVGGMIRRYNGSSWSSMTSGTTEKLYGVHGTSASDIWAVGDEGVVLHYNGSSWSTSLAGIDVGFFEKVFAADTDDVYAVGRNTNSDLGMGCVMWHYDGSSWSEVDQLTDRELYDVWGLSASDIYVVGDHVVLHYHTVAADGFPVLYGKISDLRIYNRDGIDYARMVVKDGLEYLQNQTVFVDCNFGSGGATSDTFAGNIGRILTAASWPWQTNLSVNTEACTWHGGDNYETPAASLIWELRESDFGEFYVARDGKATYKARLSEMPSAVLTLDDDDILLGYDLPMPWDYIRNKCVVQSSRWFSSSDYSLLWLLRNEMQIANSEKYDSGKKRLTYQGMWAAGNYADVYRIKDDSGDFAPTSRWSKPDVNPASYTTAFVDVETTNDSGAARRLKEIDLYFNPAAWFDILNERATDSDSTSITAYGERMLLVRAKWRFQTDDFDGWDMANSIVTSLKDPRPFPTIKMQGQPSVQFGLELRNVIRINSTTLMLSNKDYHIGQIEHRWMDESGQRVETTIKTEPCIIGGSLTPDDPGEGDEPDGTSLGPDDLVGGDLTVNGALTLGDGSELTISGGAVTATSSFHLIDTESDAASDDLDTINGAATGRMLVIRAVAYGRTVVCKDGTGNLYLAGDFSLNVAGDRLTLMGQGTDWYELSRSDNS